MDLPDIRMEIDALDSNIVSLLSRRAELVSAAGNLKTDEQGIRDPKRIEQVIAKIKLKADETGLDPALAEEIYRTIIECFVRKEMSEFSQRMEHAPAPTGGYRIRNMIDHDQKQVLDIFNYHAEHGYAAYPETRVPEAYFALIRGAGKDYPWYVGETEQGAVIGFCMLRQHHRASAFDQCAEIGYFNLPEHIGKGLGTRFLATLEADAGARGIRILLANISSLNEGSIKFHRARGFKECGRFKSVGRKFGRNFDVIWMQKNIFATTLE